MNSFIFTARSGGYYLSCSLVFFGWTTIVSSMAIVVINQERNLYFLEATIIHYDKKRIIKLASLLGTCCMTKSSSNILYDLDLDIELTLQRLRKVRSTIVSTNNSPNFSSNSDNSVYAANNFDCSSYSSSNNNTYSNLNLTAYNKLELMENQDRTLKELAMPDVVYQPWCIEYSQLKPTQSYELKSGLLQLLPKFHGLAGEDPHKNLKEFHIGIPKDYIKMKAFPFLDGAAKDWLYIQPTLFNTWGDMKCTFLEKFLPEICGIRQHAREILYEYWERFNIPCATCPHHRSVKNY
ncbi:hypothetical protein CR513_18850, partial [Mucuna pruriens]